MPSLIAVQQRSENGFGFERPGLKTGVENDIFWSEIGSGFGEPGGTPLPRIPRSTPHHGPGMTFEIKIQHQRQRHMDLFSDNHANPPNRNKKKISR